MHEIAGALGAVVVGLLVVPAAVELLQQYRHGALERPELRCACGRMGTSDRCRPLSRSTSPRGALPLPPLRRPAARWEARLARRVLNLTRASGYEDLR